MKKILLFLILSFVLELRAQESEFIIRTTTSIATVHHNDQNGYILQQSTGQASVIGAYESDGHFLSQGFVQTEGWMKLVNSDHVLGLKTKIFPNPFVDVVNVSFLETVNQPVHIAIFNDLGSELKSVTYDPSQELSVNLEYLPMGSYYIRISTNHKQSVNHLIKND